MLKIFFYLSLSLFIYNFSWAGDCDTTISSATTTQLVCADNDTLTVSGSITLASQETVDAEGEDGVTITNTGTIQATGATTDKAIQGKGT